MQKPAQIWFIDRNHGIATNESVLAGLRVLSEDDDLVDDYPELRGAILVSSISRQHDGIRGRATEVLKTILNHATRNSKAVFLIPASGGELTTEQLAEWYARHGFAHYAEGMVYNLSPSGRSGEF